MTKNCKILQLKKFLFFYQNIFHPLAFMKDSKLQEKPAALQKEHPSLQNIKFLYFLLFLWVFFALLDPDPDPHSPMRIRVQPTKINVDHADPDPDPLYWFIPAQIRSYRSEYQIGPGSMFALSGSGLLLIQYSYEMPFLMIF